MIKAILFDFGGVVYQHPKRVVPVILSKIYHVPVDVADNAYMAIKRDLYSGQTSIIDFIDSISLSLNKNLDPYEVKKLWLKYYAEVAVENPQIIQLIGKLRKNYKVYLFSNTTEISHTHNKTTGIYKYFDDVFLSFKMKLMKPEPVFFRQVMKKTGFKADEYLLVDDTEENLKTAQKLGLHTIHFDVLTDDPNFLMHQMQKLPINF